MTTPAESVEQRALSVAEAWQEGYRQGVLDERTSEANIGIAGFDAKVEPARNNPYALTAAQPHMRSAEQHGAQEAVAWIVDWPDEPDLGHYFADEPNPNARSRPLIYGETTPQPAVDVGELAIPKVSAAAGDAEILGYLDDLLKAQGALMFARGNYDEGKATDFGVAIMDFMRLHGLRLRAILASAQGVGK